MKNIIVKICMTVLGLFFALASGARADQISASDDDLIVGARAMIIGRVLSTACRLDPVQDRIFTYVTLRVEETLKGEIDSATIVLKEEGGEVEGQGSIIFNTPQFSSGERVFLYLDTWPDGSLRVHQMSFGKFSVVEHADGRQTVVRSEPGCAAIVNRATHHTNRVFASRADNIDLSDYARVVRARLEVNQDRSRAFQLRHYRDAAMLAQPPEYDRASAKGELHPQFKLLYPVKSVRWFEPDSNQPVVFYINPEGAPNPQVVEDVGAAMIAWSNLEGSTLRLVNGGPRNVCSTQRTLNAISFNNCDGRFSPSAGCSFIIALGGLKWLSEETRPVNGQSYVKAAYAFISFNPYSACSYDNHCTLREVATHELGHALGLGHSLDPEATMAASAHFDGRCASITQDDASGIAFAYPVNDLGSRPLTIESASPIPKGVSMVSHLQALSSAGGVLPHSWSVVDFLGRVPPGLILSSGGILHGLPLEAGTFNFTAQVDDGQGTSVQKRYSMVVREPIPYDAQFISQTIVPAVEAGQQFTVLLKWLNSGSETWDSTIRPAPDPATNTAWNANIAPVPGFIRKGLPFTVKITAVAPRVAGTYDFQWQLHQQGRGFIGEPSANRRIIVTPGPPSIESSVTPQAFVGSSFSYQLTATGGAAPHVWSITSGLLPSGLGLNSLTGVISGIPTAVGTATFTAQVTDSAARSAQRQFSISVAPQPSSPLHLNVSALLQAVRGTSVSYQPEATGGTLPYSWSITAGSLPAGMALNNISGAISGTPSVSGDFSVTLAVRDQRGQLATGSIQVRVVEPEPAPVITKVKYKVPKRQLVVIGDRIDPNATLLIDGAQVTARYDEGVLIAKPVPLTPGAHAVRIVNPSGVSSETYSLTVE